MAMAGQTVVVVFLMVTAVMTTWVEETVYEGDNNNNNNMATDDVTSSQRRQLLLSVLINLDRLYRQGNGHPVSFRDQGSDPGQEETPYDLDTTLLQDIAEEENKGQPSKRARSDVFGVLPPFGELCRAMHLGGCSHSRHK